MKTTIIRPRAVLTALLLAGACTVASCQPSSPVAASALPTRAAERSGTHIWIERPWEMRYFLFVTQSWRTVREVAVELNAKPNRRSLKWEQVFEPYATIPLAAVPNSREETLSVVAIAFDKQGQVTTPHTHDGPLRGRLDDILRIVLSEGDAASAKQYRLGEWFLGLGDISTDWAPGLCGVKNMPSPFSKTDTLYLYGPKFELSEHRATFGCREWAAQLYDDARPYIDVTSYVPKGETFPHGTYIREFIGWARFDDKKPVIGKHEKLWYCLHDCPGGDKPGPIADINAWTAKNGWRVPKRPTRIPVFPDPPAKSGTYPQ